MLEKIFVVDLDGCLSKSDILEETVIVNICRNPFVFFVLIQYLLQGKVAFKKAVFSLFGFDAKKIIYDKRVVELCETKKKQGYKVILCTGSLQEIAEDVQRDLQVFDDVIGTVDINNTRINKINKIKSHYPDAIVEYIGNSDDDVVVFKHCNKSYLINYKKRTLKKISNINVEVIGHPVKSLRNYLKMLRPHQWSKNLLVFVAIFTSFKYLDFNSIFQSSLVFVSLSLCASSHYILNDILDIYSDRNHQTKKYRQIASGNVSLFVSVCLSALFVVLSVCLSYTVSLEMVLGVCTYLLLTNIYSFFLKEKVALDIICLASLFTLRIVCGSIAISVSLSPWLLMVSFFFFFSLATLKRKVELSKNKNRVSGKILGRGYFVTDLPVINALGVSSGLVSCLVFALFINANPSDRYSEIGMVLLWLIIPFILYWISYVWILSERLLVDDDPVKFALKDRCSLFVISTIVVLFLAAGVF